MNARHLQAAVWMPGEASSTGNKLVVYGIALAYATIFHCGNKDTYVLNRSDDTHQNWMVCRGKQLQAW